jgi:metallo-beta-lactamase family protein
MQLSFHGAAKTVTGSCFLIEYGAKLLVDIGMFQGSLEKRNRKNFPFSPEDIDYLLVTHSHLDHIGLLPKLVKSGFSGTVYTTEATKELAKYMLMDSAKIQEEEAFHQTKKNLRRGYPEVKPLYTTEDVKDSLNLKWKTPDYDRFVDLDGFSFRFRNSGHVLGSAFIELECEAGKFVFSGDIGDPGRLIIRDPEFPEKADYLIIESTYGDRNHKTVEESIDELKTAIQETFARGGNVLIPSFALERTQEILFVLHLLYRRGELPQSMVFLDSPLAIDITQVFLSHKELYDELTMKEARNGNPFYFPGLHYTKDVSESREINEIKGGAIIIAGSGMCTGGRIKHHLKHNLWRSECSVVFVGFQPKGTLGRRIIDGAKTVRIYGEQITVKASIYTINGFSAHAGKDFLLKWGSSSSPEKVFIVHGEAEKAASLSRSLKEGGMEVSIPDMRQRFTL